jgi:dTDP-D-glucose 4,6-dehydratase
MNTVHVDDVSRALWYLTTHGNNGEVYNLVDNGETSKCFKCIVEPPVCDTLGTESCMVSSIGQVLAINILYTLDSPSLLVKLKPRIFQRLPPFE